MNKKINVLVHGAVQGSNFGDCLYAIIYNHFLQQEGYDVYFWNDKKNGVSNFLRKQLPGGRTASLDNMDLLVYMPGGYFTDVSNDKKKIIRRYERYFALGENAIEKGVGIAISGVGDGTILDNKLNTIVGNIITNAKRITFRSKETSDYFSAYTENGAIVAADPILMTRYLPLPALQDQVLNQIRDCDVNGEKKLLLHIYGRNNHNEQLLKKIVPAINEYAKTHNVHVFLVTDYKLRFGQSIKRTKIYKEIKAEKTVLEYTNPLYLCAVLKSMDCIITEKLHVGVISALFGKSVISFPINAVKTKRFYEKINQIDRSTLMTECDEQIALKKIEKYMNCSVAIPDSILIDSDIHMKELLSCIKSFEYQK